MKKSFEEELFSEFYTIFRVAGVGLTVTQMDRLREACVRLSSIIEAQNKLAVIDKIEKVQQRILEAFKSAESRIDRLEEHISIR